ncbi:alanine dehydrogenase [Pseudovibrio ascidiaceicola]|jgi:alanine dehydrogenase|uniref:Alanine dehydrogenase n=1 Tax=Pseudovibrio ascidiaceicola TaxID=285279 RepID=A0A1I4G379_9HYPH|nr:alanine dehydrogenase [Pseudovibrio ascidiaceicola]SFK77100.1 alanine dehydrogenase [Pseudovibrio ascidiaceicola]SFL24578.1 alanine dehydrogenase [Pseudovibrio ascidiaceicola]
MLVGVPKEIKNHEYRVGLTPDSVREVVAHGHEVVVETNAGVGIGASDADYTAAGASILPTAAEVFAKAEMIVKVKEPQAVERKMLRPDHLLFTYLHLAPDPEQTADLVASGAVCIAYETVTDEKGRLPLLAPMSQVAGRLSIQAGATALQKANGGAGVLLGGVPGVAPAKTVVIGGGVVGAHAIEMAIGLGSDVTVLDRNVDVLDALSARFGSRLKTVFSNRAALEKEVLAADLVVGAVLVAGAAAPKLVTKEHIKAMKPGSVVVDVAIDQGGCFETSRATTHQDPTYIVDEVVHYCVANMPGAVARTSTYALNNATLPYVLALADKGYAAALRDIPGFLPGLNVYKGQVTVAEVAENLGYTYVAPEAALVQETEAA